MIGPEFTVITTSLGSLPAKRTTTMPDFAGALVREIKALDLPAGTPVVIVVSGSLVGANIATIAATEALGLRPDGKSVGWGKSVSVRVDVGGRLSIKKKNKKQKTK